jgi:CHAT domain-containing protein
MTGVEPTKLREYLLDKLTEAEEEQVELRLLSDPGFAEEYDIVVDELVSDYVNGRLAEADIRQMDNVFFKSSERQAKRRFALALKQRKSELTAKRRHRQQLFKRTVSIAASVLVAVGAFSVYRMSSDDAGLNRGLASLQAAFREERPFEARISQFDYAPYIATRGPGAEKVDQDELRRAELLLLEAIKRNQGPTVHYGLGKVYLAQKEFDKAIEQFDEAVKNDPKNAQLYSDLGAAWLEKGKVDLGKGNANPNGPEAGKAMEDFSRSLENLNRASTLNPNLLEVFFNTALVHEELVLPHQAEDDWKKYLEKDANSRWAEEARRHLKDIEEGKKARSQNKVGFLSEFVTASESHNRDHAYELMSQNMEAIAGQLMWWQLAAAFLESSSTGKSDSSVRYEQALAYAGELQESAAGDRFISELVAFYRSGSIEQLAAVAKAHSMIDAAHVLMARSEVGAAFKLYTKAKTAFDAAGDQEESLFADYWIGYSHYRQSEFAEGQSRLTQLADRCQAASYLWLLEKALTMIANIQVESSQYSQSIASYSQSLEISRKINDAYNIQKNLSSLANSYRNLGKRQESLAYIQRCLESSQAHWAGARQMYRNYYAAGGVLNSFGYYAVAAEYEKAALLLALEQADPVFENQAYVALSAIYAKLQDYGEGLRFADLSNQTAQKMDERSRLRTTADSLLQLGHINRQTGNHDRAIASYDEAIKLYDDSKLFAFLYEAHKGRLLSYIAQNNDRARGELQTVLGLFEEHRAKIKEEKNRNSFFDLEQSVYDVAIDFEYSKDQDYEKAFDYSEVSRARSLLDMISRVADVKGDAGPNVVISSVAQPLTLREIRERMPAEVQILQYAVLDDKLLVWVISKTRFQIAEKKVDSKSLTEKVLHYSKSVSTSPGSETEEPRREGMELYQILISPVESLLEKEKQIYVVPDKALNSLAFNALISPNTGKYLVADYQLSFAPSSNVFLICSEMARQRAGTKDERLLSVGDPHFSRQAFPDFESLPSSGREARQIADYYKLPHVLVGDDATKARVSAEMDQADVIHIASHYVIDEQDPMLSKLLLTTDRTGSATNQAADGVLLAHEICNRKLATTRLVTLSACQTGVERYYGGEGMIGMSRMFLAAGVPLVVASLWPVASDPTADLMTNFHRYRKQAGLSTSQALRQAQLDMIGNNTSQYSPPYYWASFVLIGGYAAF